MYKNKYVRRKIQENVRIESDHSDCSALVLIEETWAFEYILTNCQHFGQLQNKSIPYNCKIPSIWLNCLHPQIFSLLIICPAQNNISGLAAPIPPKWSSSTLLIKSTYKKNQTIAFWTHNKKLAPILRAFSGSFHTRQIFLVSIFFCVLFEKKTVAFRSKDFVFIPIIGLSDLEDFFVSAFS